MKTQRMLSAVFVILALALTSLATSGCSDMGSSGGGGASSSGGTGGY